VIYVQDVVHKIYCTEKIRGPRCAYEDNIKICVTELDMMAWTEFIRFRIASTLLLL
jgi:hypothetical protein